MKLSKEDWKLISNILDTVVKGLIFVNDYYSWEKEYWTSKNLEAGRIVNVISVIMRTESLSLESSKERVKRGILEFENQYVLQRTLLYQAQPPLSFHLKQLVEVAGMVFGGIHYWTAT